MFQQDHEDKARLREGIVLKKNDRPGDDGTLRSVKLLVFLLGVIDIASASA